MDMEHISEYTNDRKKTNTTKGVYHMVPAVG